MVDVNHQEFACHQNAGTWARDNPGGKVVHRWMVFDHERTSRGVLPLVNFDPHSIIETDDDERHDVTPSRGRCSTAHVLRLAYVSDHLATDFGNPR